MEHLEIQVFCPKNISEFLIQELFLLQFTSFQEEEDFFYAYIEKSEYSEEEFNSVISKYIKLGNEIRFEIKTLKNINWNKEWEKNYDPIIIDNKFFIKAPFHKIQKPDLKTFIISPSMAFGTGHHATTKLIMHIQQKIDFKNKRVLDYGCGTGILSIFSEFLGAKEIVAIDNDENAINCTQENIEFNNCKKILPITGEIDTVKGEKFDIILANITRNIIIKSAKSLAELLSQDSVLITSGYFYEDNELIINKLSKENFIFAENYSEDKWSSCLFKMNK
ncbi:MAG: 50S ribosomal protein L11 methyltransferase [Bacteroidota bacterium]|nr:50S ribosomal protein L11 methyltransferase [Bacteroidota bacterium]